MYTKINSGYFSGTIPGTFPVFLTIPIHQSEIKPRILRIYIQTRIFFSKKG
jgi:hypothetical protein